MKKNKQKKATTNKQKSEALSRTFPKELQVDSWENALAFFISWKYGKLNGCQRKNKFWMLRILC